MPEPADWLSAIRVQALYGRMARFDAVLFDLDGTLLDSLQLIIDSYRHTLLAHGLAPRTDADILAGLGTPLEVSLGRFAETPGDVEALVATYIAHNLEVHDALVQPYPGVCDLVHALADAGTPLAIVTSKRRRGTEMGLLALGLESRFEVLVCADDVERPKPHPEPVLRALRALSVEPARAVFVGDAVHDLHSGRAAGVHTVAVTWGAGREDDLRAAEPSEIARDADELRALLA